MKLADLIEEYLSVGKITFARKTALKDSKLSVAAFNKGIARLQKKIRVIQPKRGFFVIVKPEDRKPGGPPPLYFINQLMEHLGQPYYIGALSAAELHGVSPQSPQVLQVVTNYPVREVTEGRAHVCFITNRKIKHAPVEIMKTPAGYVKVSTSEAAAVDSFFYKNHAGGLDSAASILLALAKLGKIDSAKLFKAVVKMHDIATVQRIGFVLDKFGFSKITSPIKKWIQGQKIFVV
ncbi:MAG: type IV toxin-antitoxin system AbiEi family antitoxin, partial [Elusimicrobia bacterium]|nr:type IV toxin-antitoxin system AbiEi family antitoxin [Elusimicrobiota bacterium]